MRTIPKLRSDLVVREVEEDFLVYDPKNGEIYLLNPTAAAIAEFCTGKLSLENIAQEIEQTVAAVTPQQVRMDVENTISDFERKGLLEWQD